MRVDKHTQSTKKTDQDQLEQPAGQVVNTVRRTVPGSAQSSRRVQALSVGELNLSNMTNWLHNRKEMTFPCLGLTRFTLLPPSDLTLVLIHVFNHVLGGQRSSFHSGELLLRL